MGKEIERERERQELNNREVDLEVELDGTKEFHNRGNDELARQKDLFGSSERQTLSGSQEPRSAKQEGN